MARRCNLALRVHVDARDDGAVPAAAAETKSEQMKLGQMKSEQMKNEKRKG